MAADKDLKKLGRAELVDILCRQREMIDELNEQNRQLEARAREAERRCAQYENTRREEAERREADDALREQMRRVLERVDCMNGAISRCTEAERRIEEAQKQAEEILSQAQAQAEDRLREADAEIDRRREEFTRQCEELLRGHEALRRLMNQ